MESPLPACWKEIIFSSVNSHSDNTVFSVADYPFAAFVDSVFDRRSDYTLESSAGKILINF
jgi:hypothetical protein